MWQRGYRAEEQHVQRFWNKGQLGASEEERWTLKLSKLMVALKPHYGWDLTGGQWEDCGRVLSKKVIWLIIQKWAFPTLSSTPSKKDNGSESNLISQIRFLSLFHSFKLLALYVIVVEMSKNRSILLRRMTSCWNLHGPIQKGRDAAFIMP